MHTFQIAVQVQIKSLYYHAIHVHGKDTYIDVNAMELR